MVGTAYDRTRPPVDHSAFGVPLSTRSALLSSEKQPWVEWRGPDVPFSFPEAKLIVPPDVTPSHTEFLAANEATFIAGMTHPCQATLIYPQPDCVLDWEGERFLVEETHWHSELHFHRDFRRDESTGWAWRWSGPGREARIAEECVIAYSPLNFIYFHWFFDTLCKIWLWRRQRGSSKGVKYYVGKIDLSFKLDSLPLFDLGPEDIVPAPEAADRVSFSRATLPVFAFIDPARTRFSRDRGIHHKGWSPDFVTEIRELAHRKFAIPKRPKDLRLYVDRHDTGHRRVTNDAEVKALCESLGFQVITPGQVSLAAQVELYSRARLIVGCHGAGLTNIMWAGPGSSLVEFMPNGYDDAGYRFLAPLSGVDYYCLCARSEHPERHDDFEANCEVHLPTLRNLLTSV